MHGGGGGDATLISNSKASGSACSKTTKAKLITPERCVLEELYFCVQKTHCSSNPFDVVKPVSDSEFCEAVSDRMKQNGNNERSDITTLNKAIEMLNDRGVITQNYSAGQCKSIAFGAPSVFYHVGDRLPGLSHYETHELRYPTSAPAAANRPDNKMDRLAESTALRLLAIAAHYTQSLLGTPVRLPSCYIEKMQLVTGMKFETHQMYKEACGAHERQTNANDDQLGADGFVIDDDRRTVYRIQVKLAFDMASSLLNTDDVINGFERGGRLERAAKSYRLLLGLDKTAEVKQKLFVLTNKGVNGTVRSALSAKDIYVISATAVGGWPRELAGSSSF